MNIELMYPSIEESPGIVGAEDLLMQGAAGISMQTPGGPPAVAQSMSVLDKDHYQLSISGPIGPLTHFTPAISVLLAAGPESKIEMMIDSPGGDLTTAIMLVTLIHRCKGTVTVHAVGEVQSAASFIFAFAPNRVVYPAAQFMYHGAAYGRVGKVAVLRDYVRHISDYTSAMLKQSLALGILTEEEVTRIEEDQAAVYLSGIEVAARLNASASQEANNE